MLEISTRRSSKKTIDAVIIRLNDQELKFTGRASIKLEKVISGKDDTESNLFSCLNDYVEDVFSTDQKVELYKKYARAHVIVDSGKFGDYHTELMEIKPIITEILDFIRVQNYCSFIQHSKHLMIPKDLSEAASKGDYPEQTTIMDNDYVELVKLAFVVRTVYPIIFGLISRFEETMGSEYSEYVCGALIKDNPEIIRLRGWEKLTTYVHFAFGKRGVPTQADSVTSMENFVDKVLFNTLFSRLCCAVIPETEDGKNLATAINAAVKQHEGASSSFRKKDEPTEGEDDKRSLYDKYQISEAVRSSDEVSQGEFFSFGLFDESDKERHVDRFKHQCVALKISNPGLVERVYDNLPPNWEFFLEDHNLKLLQLTYFQVVSPFTFEACDYTQLMAAIVLAQVKLSEQGYKYLPSILGAIHNPAGSRYLPDGLKFSDDDRDFLSSICDVQTRNNEGRSFNEALVAAQDFIDKFGNGIWQSNLEYGVLDNPEVYQRVKKGALFPLDIEVEIKNEFIQLIRQINE